MQLVQILTLQNDGINKTYCSFYEELGIECHHVANIARSVLNLY